MPMANQVRRAVACIYKNAKSFGGDSSRLYELGTLAKNLTAAECNDRPGRRGKARGHGNAEGRQQ
jgi:hypothetical protein